MPSTNKTDKLHLSQFEPTDKPSFIQDYNADMAKIEQAIDAKMDASDINVIAPLKSKYGVVNDFEDSVAIGNMAVAQADYCVAIGSNVSANDNSVGIGYGASAGSPGYECSVAIGTRAAVTRKYSVALGYDTSANRANEVSIGNTNASAPVPRTRLLANVTDPELDQDAATKHYVDNAVQNATASAQACIDMLSQNIVDAPVHKLSDTATLADVIAAYNKLVEVLAGSKASQLTTE